MMLDAPRDQPDFRQQPAPADLAQALLTRSETGLIAIDETRHVVLANPAAREFLGVGEPVIGQPLPALLRRGSMLAATAAGVAERWLDGPPEAPLFLPLEAGTELSVVSAAGPGGHRLLSLQRRAAAPAPPKDASTGWTDRRDFVQQLKALMTAPNATPALLLLELDRVRPGPPPGDALPQLVAKRLAGALRDADVICRLSGIEFAVLIKRPNDPAMVGRRLVQLLSRPYLIEGATVSVGANIGTALAPDHGSEPAALIRAANVALHAARKEGRGAARVFGPSVEG